MLSRGKARKERCVVASKRANKTNVCFKIYVKNSPFVALQPPDDKYERWYKIPVSLKKKAAQLMHVSAFWYHILLCRESQHLMLGCASGLPRFKLLEDQTRHMIWISNTFNLHVLEVLDDTICWLEQTGEPRIKQQVQELGPRGNCFAALQLFFAEYAHYTQAMGVSRKKCMRELAQGPCQWFIEKGEEMKAEGSDQFQEKK
ncbi:uncharacterized protein LOC135550776 [Oncorhynchus masou masou]|uniref:uncharacterized protein LOC135550776 n=1 Tax=Oncorhynchus masou masou TaxID=90313 RepID=UPI003183202A